MNKKKFVGFVLAAFSMVMTCAFTSCLNLDTILNQIKGGEGATSTNAEGEDGSHEHRWGEWTVVLEADCETNGKERRVCDDDEEHSEERDIRATGHAWGDWYLTEEPTCAEVGKECRVCANNEDHIEYRDIPKTETHRWLDWDVTKEPTCVETGVRKRTCALTTDHTQEESIPVSTAHDWGSWYTVKESTCAVEGKEERVCALSKEHVQERAIPKTNEHVVGENETCTICNKTVSRDTPTVTTMPKVSTIYYGETATLSGGVAQVNGETITGTWTIESSTLTGEGTENVVMSSTRATVTFTPMDSSRYKKVEMLIDVPMYAVASYNGVYYSTLDDALAVANEMGVGTVYALPSDYLTEIERALLAKTILTTTEIQTGVTLSIPYEGVEMTVKGAETRETKTAAFANPKEYLKNNVTVGENVTLINNGVVQIGGVITSATTRESYCSLTSGKYGQLTLEKGAQLINNSLGDSAEGLQCYGYIKETTDGESKGIVNKGTLLVPFTIMEFHGLGVYFAMSNVDVSNIFALLGVIARGVKPEVMPFNKMAVLNVAVSVKTEGGSLYGMGEMYVQGEFNSVKVPAIGYNNSFLIQLKEDAYMVADLDEATQITKLDVYGNATLNPLTLSLKAKFSGMSLTVKLGSNNAMFPINWMYDVHLHTNGAEAQVEFAQTVKIMPGGRLTVGEGVTLTTKKLIVYDEYMETLRAQPPADVAYIAPAYETRYPYNNEKIPAGKLLVCGKIEADALGGIVEAGADNAVVKVTAQNGNAVTNKELDYSIGSSTNTKVTYFEITKKLTLNVADGKGGVALTEVDGGEYCATKGVWNAV